MESVSARFYRYGLVGLSILVLIALAFSFGSSGAASAQDLSEKELFALEQAPPLPENIQEMADLVLAAARGELTMLHLSDPVPVPETVIETRDIEYGNVNGRPLLLDLYRPKEQSEPLPGVLFIHGGGWSGGKRSDYKYYCVRFPQMGYVVATVSYRLVGEATFPACVEDVKCAVRWMRAHAEEYGIDPDRIAAIGGSAGGHLSMMLGYAADVPELEGAGGHAEYSSAVQAVVNLYGPTDLTPEEFHEHPTLVSFFGGKTFSEAEDQYRLASPLTHLKAGAPPTLVIHGTDDDVVPVAQADLLVERLKELEVPHAYLRMQGYPHTLDILLEINRHVRWHIYHFLDEHLK